MKRRQAGVTLIEVMVAVTLLSLMSLGMVIAIQVGLSAYSRTETRLMDNRRVAGAQRIVQSELQGLVPAFVYCGGNSGPANKAIFFQGTPEGLTMVSTFSVQQGWRGQAQILQLFVMPGGTAGGVRLAVNEIPYGGPVAAGQFCTGTFNVPNSLARLAIFQPPSPGPTSFVLADKLSFCQFSYYSPPAKLGDAPSWQSNWASKGWPWAIRIQMAPIAPDPSSLQPVTVTAPIHVRRDTENSYADQN